LKWRKSLKSTKPSEVTLGTIGQFMKHAAVETVDNVLLDLSKVKQELINFTLT